MAADSVAPYPNGSVSVTVPIREGDYGSKVVAVEPGGIEYIASSERHGRPLDLAGIDWLIAGGESGQGARPVDVRWVRELRDACEKSDVAFFFKQWGGRTAKAGGRELDGQTFDAMPRVATG